MQTLVGDFGENLNFSQFLRVLVVGPRIRGLQLDCKHRQERLLMSMSLCMLETRSQVSQSESKTTTTTKLTIIICDIIECQRKQEIFTRSTSITNPITVSMLSRFIGPSKFASKNLQINL